MTQIPNHVKIDCYSRPYSLIHHSLTTMTGIYNAMEPGQKDAYLAFLKYLELEIARKGPWKREGCSEEDKRRVITLDCCTLEELEERIK